MDREDLVRFARRDWAAIAQAKERHWLRQRQGRSAGDVLRRGDDLFRHARAMTRHGFRSAADRVADLRVHHRVGLALRAVTLTSR